MKLTELKAGQGSVNVEVEVESVDTPREINKMGRTLRVANATVKDDSGSMTMTLWNDDVDKVSAGSKLKIENGYVSEFKGVLQLTSGKYGKLIVL